MGISPRVGFIPTAVGGTSLAAWSPPYGTQWQQMVATVQGAMDAAGPGAKLRGMIWVQVRRKDRMDGWTVVYVGFHLIRSSRGLIQFRRSIFLPSLHNSGRDRWNEHRHGHVVLLQTPGVCAGGSRCFQTVSPQAPNHFRVDVYKREIINVPSCTVLIILCNLISEEAAMTSLA